MVHLLREAEVAHADDVVPARLGGVGLELFIDEVHFTQGLKDAVEIHFPFAHGGVLVDSHVRPAPLVQPGGIQDIAAVLRLVPGVRQEHVGQFVAGVLEHMAHVALALVVEEAVRGGIHIAQVLGLEGFDDVTGLVVQLAEVIGVGLDFHPQSLPLDDGEQFLHGAEEHAVANLLLVGVAGELRVDDGNPHVHGNLNHPFPVGHGVLSLFLGGAGPAIDHDEAGDFHTGLLQSLPVLLFALLGKEGMLVEGVDAGMGGLFDILVAPVGHLADIVPNGHLLGQYVNVKGNLHSKEALLSNL